MRNDRHRPYREFGYYGQSELAREQETRETIEYLRNLLTGTV